MKTQPDAAQQRGPTSPAQHKLIGAKVTHRNAPERIGVVLSVKDGIAVVEYTHGDGLGRTFSTFGEYALAELTTT